MRISTTSFCEQNGMNRKYVINALIDCGYMSENYWVTDAGKANGLFTKTINNQNGSKIHYVYVRPEMSDDTRFLISYERQLEAQERAIDEKAATLGGYSITVSCRRNGFNADKMRMALRTVGILDENNKLLERGINLGAKTVDVVNNGVPGSYVVYPVNFFDSEEIRSAYANAVASIA